MSKRTGSWRGVVWILVRTRREGVGHHFKRGWQALLDEGNVLGDLFASMRVV